MDLGMCLLVRACLRLHCAFVGARTHRKQAFGSMYECVCVCARVCMCMCVNELGCAR